ncbi:hypothetical protein [Campylobacter hyointestinalis]|nr:hypothetical protein [Campylobacter hyointestinalis]
MRLKIQLQWIGNVTIKARYENTLIKVNSKLNINLKSFLFFSVLLIAL